MKMELKFVFLLAAFIGFQVLVTGNALPTRLEQVGMGHGIPTNISKYPFMAACMTKGDLAGSAVILNDKWILTTATNILPSEAFEVTFRVGSDKYAKGGQLLHSSKVVVHELYDPHEYDYDIAVVKVKNMKMGENVTAAQLATKNLQPNTTVNMVGWGPAKATKTPSPMLLEANVTSLKWTRCVNANERVTERQMCTYYKKWNYHYFNDRGDPLVHDGQVYGLWSYGQDGHPDVYTFIPAFADWIANAIKD